MPRLTMPHARTLATHAAAVGVIAISGTACANTATDGDPVVRQASMFGDMATTRWRSRPSTSPAEPVRASGVVACSTSANASPRTGSARPNVVTDFSPEVSAPRVAATSHIDPMASVVGAVEIGPRVYVAPLASIRGDEGQPIHVGRETNVQDGVVVHALETISHGRGKLENTYEVDGDRYAVFIGDRVSLAHQSQVHGPAWVEDDVFVGMKALVFKAHVGRGSVIEPAANVIGVTVPPGRYVKAGTTVTDQAAADALPVITESYPFRQLNEAVVHVNTSFATAYGTRARTTPAPSCGTR